MTRVMRVVAAMVLVAVVALVAGAAAGAGQLLATLGVLAGFPWSLAAVAVAHDDGPEVVAYALVAAAVSLNVALVTFVARRLASR